jgi:zinc D-Ala-D-Ala carboxypeptidase
VKLSRHFSLEEMTKSQAALRFGIDNLPSREEIDALANLCEKILEPIRENYGVPLTPSSAYRCAELNKRIGGSSSSQHCLGEAVDIEVPGVPNLVLAWWIRTHLDFDQLILEFYQESEPSMGWVHVSTVGPDSKRHNRHEVLTYDGKSYEGGIPG